VREHLIVPVDTLDKWKAAEDGKKPLATARQDGRPMAFASLWRASSGRTDVSAIRIFD
jgi:putative SOS response-associated peptidase YedK